MRRLAPVYELGWANPDRQRRLPDFLVGEAAQDHRRGRQFSEPHRRLAGVYLARDRDGNPGDAWERYRDGARRMSALAVRIRLRGAEFGDDAPLGEAVPGCSGGGVTPRPPRSPRGGDRTPPRTPRGGDPPHHTTLISRWAGGRGLRGVGGRGGRSSG